MKIKKPVHPWFSGLVLVVVLCLVGILWYLSSVEQRVKRSDVPVITENNNEVVDFDSCVAAGNPIMESFPEQCRANGQTYTNSVASKALIQESKLPSGWVSTGSLSAEFNEGIGADKSVPSCFAEVSLTKIQEDRIATISAEQLFEEINQQVLSDKGYVTTVIDKPLLELQLNGTTQQIEFYEVLRQQEEVQGSRLYQTEAYIVGKKDYAIITLSCSNNQYDDVTSVLSAFSVSVY